MFSSASPGSNPTTGNTPKRPANPRREVKFELLLGQGIILSPTVPNIHIPDGILDGSYDSQVVPPSPSKPRASISDKRDTPEEEGETEEKSPLVQKEPKVMLYFPLYSVNRDASQTNMLVVRTGSRRAARSESPPYLLLKDWAD